MTNESQALGRVLDPARLDAAEGPRVVLRLEAPAAWLRDGGEVEVLAPAMLPCARCGGGGCDGCGRAGAIRAPRDADRRRLRATLPPGSAAGVALRIARPFGDAAEIDQLILELRPGAASDALTRLGAPREERAAAALPPLSDARFLTFLVAAIALSAAIGALLSR